MEQVEDAIEHSNANIGGDVLMLGSQAHNVRAIGLLGKGIDPLDPNKVSQSFELETKKIDDINHAAVGFISIFGIAVQDGALDLVDEGSHYADEILAESGEQNRRDDLPSAS